MAQDPNIITLKELMDRLRISRPTIDLWRKAGLPELKGPGAKGSVKFEYDRVLAWLREPKTAQDLDSVMGNKNG